MDGSKILRRYVREEKLKNRESTEIRERVKILKARRRRGLDGDARDDKRGRPNYTVRLGPTSYFSIFLIIYCILSK